jgi:hypothetical protein
MSVKNDDAGNILERETDATIDGWYQRVEKEEDLAAIKLSHEQRCAHLPEMFRDIITRLRNPHPLGTRALMSDAAHHHGCLRREQGYTAAMLVEESRILQVSIFHTLQLSITDMKPDSVLLDVMEIADEVDSQLAQAMTGFISEGRRGSKLSNRKSPTK